MNILLIFEHLFFSKFLKDSSTRSALLLSHGFNKDCFCHSKDAFIEKLDTLGFDQQFKILQENKERRRVVALVSKNQKPYVIKWLDLKAKQSFNFINKFDSEKFAHFELAKKYPKLIPQGIEVGEDYILMEQASGESLFSLAKKYNFKSIERAFEEFSRKAIHFYINEKSDKLKLSQINQWIIETHRYGVHLKAKTSKMGFVHALKSPNDFQIKYLKQIDLIYEEIEKNLGSIYITKSLPDLDEHNCLYNSSNNEFKIVDWEDSKESIVSFDLSYLASRMIVLAIDQNQPTELCFKIYKRLLSLIIEIDIQQSQIFTLLVQWRLMHVVINPWLWPNDSTWKMATESIFSRSNKLKKLNRILNELQ